MLSLSNAFNEEDLINFEKKIINYLNDDIKFEYSVEPKIDGISASLTYIDGKLKVHATDAREKLLFHRLMLISA